jgi:4-hydroxy-4-methyl-2-oxoglutarate aldolase
MTIPSETLERYRALSTGLLSDSFREVGLPPLGLAGIVSLDTTVKVVGPAFTVQCLPAAESRDARIEYLCEIPAGAVVVIANGGRTDCSVWGGQRTLAAHQRGAVGSVVDGAFRDVEEHVALGYPVFARARTVVGSAGFANPVASQVDVRLAGVDVAPGDLVLGDGSGVIVVPAARLAEVLEVAEATAADERRVATAVAGGTEYFKAKSGA